MNMPIRRKTSPARVAIRLAAALAFAWVQATIPAHARPPLLDSSEGMTCNHHFSGVGANWQHRGGDWLDAVGELHGDRPFARAAVRPKSKRQFIEWNVTDLAQKWVSGTRPAGAMMLRTLPGSPEGVINFRSREFKDSAAHPQLIIEWADGGETRLEPTADASINCTTYKSLGGGSVVSVGGNDSTAIVFPFPRDAEREIKQVWLRMATDKQWHNGSNVGVFHLYPPWAEGSPVREGLAASYPGDRGIETDPAVYYASGFEKRDWADDWSHAGRSRKSEVVDAGEDNGFAPLAGSALRSTLEPRQNFALDLRYGFAKLHGSEPEEAYFRYYLRFGEDWNPTRDGGKLPGFGGTYDRGGWGMRKSDGTNGWSARGKFFRKKSDSPAMADYAGIGSYVYHADIKGAESQNIGWGLGPTGYLRKNQWYSVEQYVRMNDPGKSNGVLRAWVDGQLAMERKNLRFRDILDLKIENIWFNVYHGGVAKPPHEMSLYIDNVVIAREYIGPMARE